MCSYWTLRIVSHRLAKVIFVDNKIKKCWCMSWTWYCEWKSDMPFAIRPPHPHFLLSYGDGIECWHWTKSKSWLPCRRPLINQYMQPSTCVSHIRAGTYGACSPATWSMAQPGDFHLLFTARRGSHSLWHGVLITSEFFISILEQ